MFPRSAHVFGSHLKLNFNLSHTLYRQVSSITMILLHDYYSTTMMIETKFRLSSKHQSHRSANARARFESMWAVSRHESIPVYAELTEKYDTFFKTQSTKIISSQNNWWKNNWFFQEKSPKSIFWIQLLGIFPMILPTTRNGWFWVKITSTHNTIFFFSVVHPSHPLPRYASEFHSHVCSFIYRKRQSMVIFKLNSKYFSCIIVGHFELRSNDGTKRHNVADVYPCMIFKSI